MTKNSPESGLALLIVIFIITLTGALVVSLAETTYISMRMNRALEQRTQAEYLLKSAVNIARVLIKEDKTADYDNSEDLWYAFVNGREMPAELTGLNLPGVRIHLEITPEGSRIPLGQVLDATTGPKYRDVIFKLFQNLGFGTDTEEVDQTGLFPGTHFKSAEMVANLMDYIDPDKVPSSFSGTQGVEDKLPESQPFKNAPLESLDELASIPGFTPERVQKIIPYVSWTSNPKVNMNTARSEVINALIPNIAGAGQTAEQFRAGSPFSQGSLNSQLQTLYPSLSASELRQLTLITEASSSNSSWFQILAKVEYATTSFFSRAMVIAQGTGRVPKFKTFELF